MKKVLIASMIAAAFGSAQAANQTADVVVIGAGGAGMAAAVTAHDLGAKVVILEKMAFPGGNTIRATGGISAAETPQQAKLGITPNHFLRNVRLKHAAKLLTETEMPVSKISLAVGFNSPRYFSQYFRKMFGMTPSEYGMRTSHTIVDTIPEDEQS